MKMDNEKYCQECGKLIDKQAPSCPYCQAPQGGSGKPNEKWQITLILAIFLGSLGVHSFYNGKILIGILQLCTGGGCGIWTLIDIIMIIIGKFKDNNDQLVLP